MQVDPDRMLEVQTERICQYGPVYSLLIGPLAAQVKCCSLESLQLAMLKGDRIESATNCNAWMTHVSSITCICTNEYMPDVFGNLYMGSLQRLTMAHSGASSLY